MNQDEISVEILADGTIRSTTNKVSAANHNSADGFFKLLTRMAGGTQTASKRNKALEGHVHGDATQKAGQ